MKTVIRVGMSTCGLAAGAQASYKALAAAIQARGLPVTLQATGCVGACHREPLVEVVQDGATILYGPVTPTLAPTLLDLHFADADPTAASDWVVSRHANRRDYPFLGKQVKVTTQLCGVIDPHSLDDYLAHDGYQALRQALAMTPEQVIQAVKDARLRGRGGAGFPTGVKWEIGHKQPGARKFLICNADEGDPGAFMDRTMIEGDPHRLLEGMLIAAHAIGASRGYIYIRAEYPLAVKALHEAIDQGRRYGVIGRNILGSGWISTS
jgi:NADH-quinone oxidoreductase subunit F